jgi:hypothetical protein
MFVNVILIKIPKENRRSDVSDSRDFGSSKSSGV